MLDIGHETPIGWAILFGMLLALCSACVVNAPQEHLPSQSNPPDRIISMAPSLTEIAFALGLDDQVVAVTRYCDFPPQALDKPNIGGFLDPNLESIVALEPNLVLLIQDHDTVRTQLEGLGITTLQVDHSSVDGILSSIREIGSACGVEEAGRALAASCESQLAAVENLIGEQSPPSVLLVVDRRVGSGTVSRVWAAGPNTYLDDVLEAAGGINVLQTSIAAYPELSREGLISLNPDIIVDVVTSIERGETDLETARADWRDLAELRAVRSDSVFIIASGIMEVPGPRTVEAVQLIAKMLHPELLKDAR